MKTSFFIALLFFCSLAGTGEERIVDFNIECKDGVLVSRDALQDGKYYFIAIFPDKCFPCNKSRYLLDRLARLPGLTAYGVFLNREHYVNFHDTGLVKFKTWYPVDCTNFIKGINVDPCQDHILLTCGSRILFKKSGAIHFEDYKKMKEIFRSHNENSNSTDN